MTDIEYRAWYSTPADRDGTRRISQPGKSKEAAERATWDLSHPAETMPTIHYWETRTVTYTPWEKEKP